MEPTGPWYASYNRLATTTFQSNPASLTTAQNLAPVAQTGPAPQLLIQAAANSTVTLPGQPSFNTGAFLTTPTAISYDFSQLFQHANPKQAYVTNQSIQPVRAQIVTMSKPSSLEESGNYVSSQQNENFFEHQSTASSTSGTNWNVSHQTNSQVSSPFGILPHESVAVSSPSASATSKTSNSVVYNNPFGSHYSTNTTNVTGVNSKTDGPAHNFSADNQTSSNSTSLPHQTCIVSTQNMAPNNRISQIPSQSPGGTTIYLNVTAPEKQATSGVHIEHAAPDPGHDSSQSSPISYSIVDSRNLNYCSSSGSNKQQTSNGNVQYHNLSQQTTQQSSCRLYSGNTESEYHHPVRSKSAASTDSAYSSNTSQNGPDCSVKRPSPMHSHSQASPLGHVPSPATYPMYNSPMASMSSPSPLQPQQTDGLSSTPYKANSMQQQMTPPSPMDVSVTRSPSQHNQVAYSSVITRALGSSENSKAAYVVDASDRSAYDRSCWDGDGQHQSNSLRKYPASTYVTSEGSNSSVHATQQILTIPSRQSSCLQTNQMALQDLSSCRSNQIGANKRIQSLSNDCESDELKELEQRRCQQLEMRRKSLNKVSEAGLTPASEFLNRNPPPAHHNVINIQQTQQTQQNGFTDFERYITLPHAKLVATGTGVYTAQQEVPAQIQPGVNILSNNVTHQHQPLLIAAHNGVAPTVSYYPAFHVAQTQQVAQMQHPQAEEYQTIGVTSMGSMPNGTAYQQNLQQIPCTQETLSDDKPQVVVPNIEEELEFLQQPVIPDVSQNTVPVNSAPKQSTTNTTNSGFMTSYLKFLQGDKDASPPPAARGGKAAPWNRKQPQLVPETNFSQANNTASASIASSTANKSNEVQTIDYANDPRYFPLPKERKKRNLDSSDDGSSSDESHATLKSDKFTSADASCLPKNQASQYSDAKPEKGRKKGRPAKPGGPTDRKRKAAAAAAEAAAKGISLPAAGNKKKKIEQLPTRESSRRRAKENTSTKQILDSQQSTDPYDVDEEQGDSDTDPAWTPAAKATGDEDDKRKKRGKSIIHKRKKLLDGESPESAAPKRPGRKKRSNVENVNRTPGNKFGCKIDEKLLASVSDEDIDISPFKSGEFVVIKNDLDQEYPPLWRIDGKTLLQKYEPFQSNGKTLYRNISTYSGWAPQNRHIYQQVPVKYWQQSKVETIVEFLREDLIVDDSESISKSMKETEKYQDNFEVYIQTLISQALDSNFLTEIFQEQDDYFLLNVKTVDEITEDRKQRLLSTTSWQPNIVSALSTWPCVNSLRDNISDHKGKPCAGCNRTKIHARVLLYGQPYNNTTLEGSPPDPHVPIEKDFLFCRVCQTKVALFNKVAHQKYLMFLECARRVGDKRLQDSQKDTTIILNELLADENWLNQLFREVRRIWADIDSLHYQMNKKANSTSGTAENVTTLEEPSPMPSVANESQVTFSDNQKSMDVL
ncbi:hypothetical protein QAD02_014548 [Eretmocerus hayati]|uniref:Uncharacterized protein n=1 Tax=Eretmocerus hayati TaxID=131215 RepID=A0ACC2P7B5_9HYME|nr:hypothetical protein QAD02_014548 [Eretmocerus hayati]